MSLDATLRADPFRDPDVFEVAREAEPAPPRRAMALSASRCTNVSARSIVSAASGNVVGNA